MIENPGKEKFFSPKILKFKEYSTTDNLNITLLEISVDKIQPGFLFWLLFYEQEGNNGNLTKFNVSPGVW